VTAHERRDRVEHSLVPAITIAGRPAEQHRLRDRMARYAVPGVAVAVVDEGEVSWACGYGDAGNGRAVHATTLFQAASISKAVAAVGVLALVEHGDLDLDEDVNRRLRSWRLPDSEHTVRGPVTLRHLLSHTAGTTVPGFPGYAQDALRPTVPELLSGTGAANTPAVESFAAPGALQQYSGGGTTIVQQLVSDVTDRDYAELIADLVLQPFGMVDSAYAQPLPTALVGRAAIGHDDAGRPVAGGHHVYPELQAAGLWTTAVDLARWVLGVQAILRGDRTGPISPATARLMVTAVAPGTFGLGPELGGEGADRRFGHSGSNEGFRSQVDGLVGRATGAAILTNAAGGTTLCAELRRAIAHEYGWGPMDGTAVEVAELDEGVLRPLVGRYAGPFGRPMRLELADGELFSPAPYGRRRMLPLDEHRFLDEETGAVLRIERDGARVVRIAVLVDDAELMAFEPTGSDA
jgi:CubicO group peptidase (beta-lactamase class C family)